MSLRGAIFDMDGVVTDTAKLHFIAWKELFDPILQENARQKGIFYHAFTKDDYLHYLDGLPRYDGIKRFLASRNIETPLGSPEDSADIESIYGFGARKNEYFLAHLERDPIDVIQPTVDFIKQCRSMGLKIAIASSSKNCEHIIQRAGLEALFDVRVDGVYLQCHQLPGKPYPDMFLEAARLLDVLPENALVVEDALSGIQAGVAAQIGYVIGLDRKETMKNLFQKASATVVVSELSKLSLKRIDRQLSLKLPLVLKEWSLLDDELNAKQPIVFLDYDGTLTPIVEHPELAMLSDSMKQTLMALSKTSIIVVISGRAIANLKGKVGLSNLYYAGNHGFEIEGPDGSDIQNTIGQDYIDVVKKAVQRLNLQLENIPGIYIEDKTYSLSVHYRQVDEAYHAHVEEVVDAVLRESPRLQKHHGKRVHELRPKISWDKGRALQWLLSALKIDPHKYIPIYVGDDVTDEDAFVALHAQGIGVLVSDEHKASAATYRLNNTDEVQAFLQRLANRAEAAS